MALNRLTEKFVTLAHFVPKIPKVQALDLFVAVSRARI